MTAKHMVRLTPEERERLEAVVSKGHHAAYRIRHAQILLKSDRDGPGWGAEQVNSFPFQNSSK